MASSSKFDPQAPDKSSRPPGAKNNAKAQQSGMLEEAETPDGQDLLRIMASAETISKDYYSRTAERVVNRGYRAWQNQHFEGSKYLGQAWRGRSRLFVPKSRAAVRKNLATAAASLFSTEDVVNIQAQFEDDPQQRATAATIKADLDYRLTRSNAKSGIPWYLISMGACLDAQITGICCSKQSWEFQEVPTGKFEQRDEPILDETTGEVMLDELGMPILTTVEVPVMRVVRDRPIIENHPIENLGLDPAATWHSAVQSGRWFYCEYPMGLNDARTMLSGTGKAGQDQAWLDVDDETLLKGRSQDERSGARRVREDGHDRFENAKANGHLDIVWLRENFVRMDGTDYHFWSVGSYAYISKVRETREVYPEQGGDRPYVMGVAMLDSHRVLPQSPVETWQPLQMEINDIANLRLDTLKRSIAPLAIYKRGKNVDLAALQRRGQPDSVLGVDNLDDVLLQPTPGPSGAAFTETSVNNALFDELSGTFSTSSVQSSRQLNETVGGMRLMSGAANAVSEFDLRMWIETWVEPVLRQVVQLIRHFESDEKILAIAGQNARVWTRFEYMPSIEDFEQAELSLRVNAGIGALDPMQKLQKLRVAMEMLAPMMGEAKSAGISVDVEAIIEEVMGAAGFRDGRRFFKFGEPPQQQPDPEMVKLMEELKVEREQMAMDVQKAIAMIKSEDSRNVRDNQTRLQIEQMRVKSKLLGQALDAQERRKADERNRMSALDDRMHGDRLRQEEGQAQRRQRIFEMLAGSMKQSGKSSNRAAA